MISVVLYGRNDAHGYNLHRRAALSLNCIAEVLTDPDDEVIFVDYNTPDELPTFIEAIADTLTERCLDRLRVLRVPEAVHERRFAGRTHLPALEPIARNAAVRRANPANRWLLSTNTDMVFVPLRGQSMSEICADLPDGFYGLPRFELPEWLWERLPRNDPGRAIAQIGNLGPALRLDEPTVSHEWIRFDAPGDCQLILREDFTAIDGFDEEMIHGYHVDSNLSRRLLLHRGPVQTLEPHLSGYHCNHNRTRTVYHGTRLANDLKEFFFSVDEPELPAQRDTWGLADVAVDELSLRERLSDRYVDALRGVIPDGLPRVASDAYSAPFSLGYDSGHVLSHVTDALVLSTSDSVIAYIGANRVLERMLAEVIKRLGFVHPMAVARLDSVNLTSVDELADTTDVFVIDLGLDAAVVDPSFDPSGKSETSSFPPALTGALVVLERLVERERARAERTKHSRPMVLINSSSEFWNPYVLAQFDCSYTTIHSRVRRATVKLLPEGDPAELKEELAQAHRQMRWFARRALGEGTLVMRPGDCIDVTQLEDYSGFGGGWSAPEKAGIWTEGEQSELMIGLEGTDGHDHRLRLSVGLICVQPDATLGVEVYADGDRIATRPFTGPAGRRWYIDLPLDAVRRPTMQLTLIARGANSPAQLGWSTDARRLGVYIRDLTLERVDQSVRLGERVEFREGLSTERFLGDGWSDMEPTGVWTDEERAHLAFRLADSPAVDAEVVLELSPFVAATHPEVKVDIRAGGRPWAEHTFRHDEPVQMVTAPLPRAAMDPDGRMVLEFDVREPARPVDLGMSADLRRLGVQLRSLTVARPASLVSPPEDPAPEHKPGPLAKLRSWLSQPPGG